MEIQKIHIFNFKCIDDFTFDLSDINGFWEIEGVVGAGKTTLGESILFGLFGDVKGKNNNDFISWGQKHAHIELWLKSKGHDIYIKRSINLYGQSPLEVTIDDAPIVFTNKRDAQFQLENEYYDVSKLMVESLCIISFNGFKSLSTMNSKDTKEFLDQAFGFKIITEYADKCTEMRKAMTSDMSKCTTEIATTESSIARFENWLKEDEHITLEMVAKVESDIKELKNQYDQHKLTYKKKRSELEVDYTKIKSEQSAIKTQGASIKKNIDFITKGVCPTCGQPLDQSHLQEQLQEREKLLEQYKEVTANAEAAAKLIVDLDKDRDSVMEPISNEIVKLEVTLKHYNDQIQQQKRYTKTIDDLKKTVEELTKKKNQMDVDFNQWGELITILSKDVKDNILAALIPSINHYIEQYVSELRLPYIIQFDSTFTCHVEVTNLDRTIPISSLSTGQLKTVDMIIIMAVLKVLLSNVSFNIVFLDELLSNMDEELRDTMCGMLNRNLSDDKKVFIISHAKLNDQYLNGRIHVAYSNKIANYQINNL